MWQSEQDREQEELDELLEAEELEDDDPDYQFYITLMNGGKNG
jgi:hypothetical protein